MPYLSPVLTFSSGSSDLLPIGAHVHVTDTLVSTPGMLALAHFAQAALLPRPVRRTPVHGGGVPAAVLDRRNVLWVGCDGQGPAHVHSVLHKAGISPAALGQSRQGGASLVYLDALETCLAAPQGPRGALTGLYRAVEQHIPARADADELDSHARDDFAADWLVIVDDLSALAWSLSTGSSEPDSSSREVGLWVAALARLCKEVRARSLPYPFSRARSAFRPARCGCWT